MKRLIAALVVALAALTALSPSTAGPASAAVAGDDVVIGSATLALSGVDVYRSTNSLVQYTPARGATTGTNSYGFEAAVVGGKVTVVANGVGDMAIPANGYVLSGHGTARTWLQANAKVGATVTVGGTAPPPPPPPPTGASVTVAGQTLALTGTDVPRTTNALVLYQTGTTTGTNSYGYEAAVVGGLVTRAENGVGNMAIPSGGFVLSGHGTSRTWLAAYAKVGAAVVVNGGGGGPGSPPAAVVETRQVDGTVTCQTLTVQVRTEKRTNTWQWDGTAWVPSWSAWTPTGETSTRPATAEDCVHVVTSPPADALLPDLRVKSLNKCGTGDSTATGGSCFLIVNPAPYNQDFPQLQGRKLLKFPVITLNVGAGPAEVIADRTSTDQTDWKAYQTFYRPSGERQSVVSPGVKFYFAGDGHNHWHFTDFDDYWIETLGGTDLRSAEKHGYCLEDNTTWAGLAGAAGVPTSPVYLGATSCGKGLPQALTVIEGLSRGWGDTYPLTLPDQAIDVTGLPDGRYRVGITADALGAVVEGDESNNTATMEISISGNTVTTYPATATGGLN